MGAEQSQFSRLPKKQLVFISEKLVDQEFPIGNPYDGFESAYITLQEVSRYFSIEAVQEDVEFFAKFLELNENIIADLFANNRKQMNNRQLIEQLEIPVAKSYDLHFETNGTCTYTEYKSQEFDCYDKDWVRDSASQQRDDGNWNMWDSNDIHPTEYENYEENDHSYGDVYEVKDKTPIQVYQKESMLDKLVIENTKDVVNSLDKKTLLELRRIIDSKLRLL